MAMSWASSLTHFSNPSPPRKKKKEPVQRTVVIRATTTKTQSNAAPRILFAAGGTGGHVYPALAIAAELHLLNPTAQLHFAGTRERMEWTAVPKAGHQISPIPAIPLHRPIWHISNLVLPFRLLLSLWVSWRIIHKFRPHVVVGTGGYVSFPVCVMGALAGATVVIQEQNAYAGVANRVLGRLAAVVFLAFAATAVYFPRGKCVVVGNPTRRVLRERIDRVSALGVFFGGVFFGGDEEVVVVVGGSLGARVVNEAMMEVVVGLLEGNSSRYVIWQTGKGNYEETLGKVGRHPRLALLPYVDAMEMMYASADVVVARAGAITCSELLVTGTPSILIPAASVAEDHQMKNARAMADAGATTVLPEKDLNPVSLRIEILNILGDDALRKRMRSAALEMAAPDAAKELAQHVLSLTS